MDPELAPSTNHTVASNVARTQGARSIPAATKLKLAAIDLDGTLLGPDSSISPENLQAIRDLQSRGVEVVVATGRHHHSMKPFAEQLPNLNWIVSAQGAEISDLAREHILHRRFMPPQDVREVIELSNTLGFSALAYTVDGITTVTGSEADVAHYAELCGVQPVRLGMEELLSRQTYKVLWIGTKERIATLPGHEALAHLSMQKLHTHAFIFEFIPDKVSKGSALAVLADKLHILPEEAVVFGDAENDIPMFAWAGTSVAMPHSWPAALAAATTIGPASPPETAFAAAVNQLLGLAS